MPLIYVSIVIDQSLWSDKWGDQMNAIEQGLMNARGKPELYPIKFEIYEETKERRD